jgi:hypothetical protein
LELLPSVLTLASGSITGFDKDGETITETMLVLSPAVRAAPDLMAFMAVFGTETIFREKVPAGNRAAFKDHIMKLHSAESALGEFKQAWKNWLVENQEELSDMETDQEANPEAMDFYGGAAPATPNTPD